MEYQICSSCGFSKPLTEDFFHKRIDIKDPTLTAFRRQCKTCRNIDSENRTKRVTGNILSDREKKEENDKLFIEGKRRCSSCKNIKLIDDFCFDRTKKEGYSDSCKSCRIDKHYIKSYGMSFKEFEIKIKEQNYICPICKKIMVVGLGRERFAILDHDHKNGKNRGIICNHCNHGLGLFEDDIERFKNCIIYLQNERDL